MSEYEARTMRTEHHRFTDWSIEGECKGEGLAKSHALVFSSRAPDRR